MQNTSQQIILTTLILCTILILMVTSYVILILHKYKARQFEYFKEIEQIKLAHQSQILQSQLEIQEQTFQNISREIHDNINQILTLAKFHLNSLERGGGPGTQALITVAIDLIGEAINDLSDISRSLSSELIKSNGLIGALEFEVERIRNIVGHDIRLEVRGMARFVQGEKEIMIFRIVQEALNNAIRHAGGTQIIIDLHYAQDGLDLRIRDNGTGFQLTKEKPKDSYSAGLNNMIRRAELMNGWCKIESSRGAGTIVHALVPFDENNTKSKNS